MAATTAAAGGAQQYSEAITILLEVDISFASASMVMLSLAVFSGLRANICRLQHLRAVFFYFCWSLLYSLTRIAEPALRLNGWSSLPTPHLNCAFEFVNATGFYAKLLSVTYIAWLARYDMK